MKIVDRGPCARYNKSATPIRAEGVLLHTTEGGSKTYLDELFRTCRRRNADGSYTTVSVHFCVYKDGAIRQYAPWTPGRAYYCYHAGQSWMPDGRASASRYLIGIEIQHASGQVYPMAQLDALVWLLDRIKTEWRGEPSWKGLLTEHRIVSPGRKSDPTYPWDIIKGIVYDAWEADMTEQEVIAIVKSVLAGNTEVVWSDTVEADQQYLVDQGVISRARDQGKAASVSYVDSVAARVLRAAKK